MISIHKLKIRLLLLAILWVFLLGAAAGAEVVERIVAIVNDEVISQSEVEQMAKAIQSQPGAQIPPGSGKDLQRQLLEALIMKKLAKAEAKRRGIKVSDKEVKQTFEEFKKRNRIEDDKVLAQVLAKSGLSIKELKQQIADQMLHERLMSVVGAAKVVVTEEQVREFYDQQFPKTGGNQVHLKMLNMPFPPGATEAQKEEIKKKAEMILQEHRSGVSWDKLREKHSLLFQDLGFVSVNDLDPKLGQFLANVKSGETVPVQTLQGFQLVQVVGRREGQARSFVEAAPQIRRILQRQGMEKQFNEWIKGQKDRSHIKIMM